MSVNVEYRNHDKVTFDLGPIKGSGTIKGVATTDAPVIGKSYIIELDSKIEGWPWDCVTAFACQIEGRM